MGKADGTIGSCVFAGCCRLDISVVRAYSLINRRKGALMSVIRWRPWVLQAFLLYCCGVASAYYNPETGRWLSRDPIGEPGGLNLYCFVHNAAIIRLDPTGLKAWESAGDVEITPELIQKLHACLARKMEEYITKKQHEGDCADTALTALIECAAEMKIPLNLPVWDAAEKKWAYLRSEDEAYVDVKAFINDVRAKMGAISLYDRNRITTPEDVSKLQPGDLIVYRIEGTGLTGHTMVVLQNDAAKKTVTVGEGHMGGGLPEKSDYTYDQIFKRFNGPVDNKGRVWNCQCIIKK